MASPIELAQPVSGMRRRMHAVACAALGFLLLTHGGHFYAVDANTVYLTGKAVLEGRLEIPRGLGTVVGRDGGNYGMYPIGLPLLFGPFSLVGEQIDRRAPELFTRIVGPGVSVFYPENFSVYFASLAGILFGALTAAAFLGVAEMMGYRPSVAAALTAILVLATQIWPASRDGFPQIVVAFCLLGVLLHLLTWSDARFGSAPLVTGLMFGLCVLVRPFDAALAAPAILVFALAQDWPQLRVTSDPLSLRTVRFLLPVAACAAVVAITNAARFGNPLTFVPAGQTTIAFNHPIGRGLVGLLVNPQRGLLLYSPPVILGLCGMGLLARRRPGVAAFLLAVIGSYLIAYARYALWNDGVSWGGRFLVPIVPLLILPIGELLSRRRSRIVVIGCVAVFAAGVLVQLGGTIVDFHRVTLEQSLAPAGRTRQPILEHWQHLLRGQHIDVLWWRVREAAGSVAALLYVVPALALMAWGLYRLRAALGRGFADEPRAGRAVELAADAPVWRDPSARRPRDGERR